MAGVGSFNDNSFPFQQGQPIGENIGGNLFFRLQKLAIMVFFLKYQVTDNQERPPVSK
jgi:hypothetical protein